MCVNVCLCVHVTTLCKTAMQRIKEEDALKEQKLLRLVQMLELVLSSTADQVNLHPQAGNYDGMKFLCDLFSCCELHQLIFMWKEEQNALKAIYISYIALLTTTH